MFLLALLGLAQFQGVDIHWADDFNPQFNIPILRIDSQLTWKVLSVAQVGQRRQVHANSFIHPLTIIRSSEMDEAL